MSTSTISEPWLTTRQLERKLGVSRSTITRLKLPRTKVGGQNRYLMSQVVVALSGTDNELPDNVVELRPQREMVVA